MDPVKPTAAQAACRLHAAGIGTVLLTGDNGRTARAVAALLGIPHLAPGVLDRRHQGPVALYRDRSRSSRDVKLLAIQRLRRVERKIRELETIRGALADLIERCSGARRPDFPIVEELSGEEAAVDNLAPGARAPEEAKGCPRGDSRPRRPRSLARGSQLRQ